MKQVTIYTTPTCSYCKLSKEFFEKNGIAYTEHNVATDLEKPTRNRRAVNLSRINLHARNDEIVVVPGKVLSSGEIKQGLTIAAYQFSKGALEKIQQAKSQAITLNELIRKNPKGKRMRIIG